MEFTEKITVAILAGGISSRFGSSKLEAIFKGKRLINGALEIAGSISSNVIIISNQVDLKVDPACPVFPDIIIDKGPLAGIHAALTHASTEHVAIMPVDIPFLGKPIYDYLVTQYNGIVPVVVKSQKGLDRWILSGLKLCYRK